MIKENYDFYSPYNFKLRNLDPKIQYQLDLLASHDLITRKHSENVANLVYRLCEYLHCNSKFILYATTCALLHDIGKLFVPLDILTKPGSLTDEEFEIMKKHTTLGYELCYKDLKLRPYCDGALYHHESLNGTGYPNGVTKKEIPYVAQIIRVADEYDAIVSKRQYKTHIGISDTLKILIENAQNGKNNPLIVRKLCKVVIEDIEYEIFLTQSYVGNLAEEIKRLKQVEKYEHAMNKAKSQNNKDYYFEGMKVLLRAGETPENYHSFIGQYEEAYKNKKAAIETLYNEIKIIKKLKV